MLTFGSHVDGFYDVSDQMVDDLRRRAEAQFRRREREREALTSIAAFEEHRARVRQSFLEAIGGLPERRSPLRARCTGVIDRGGYVIEKLVYESLPEFYVAAALYLPRGLDAPAPAVLFVCGHSDLGKAYPTYQAVAVDLVTNGFVVLAMDPPGQGERFQYFDVETGRRVIGGCTTEHTHAGLQFLLQGASIARHFIWDGIRAVDLLCERPEVDPQRIGLTGNSGGGTQAAFLMMAEPRFAAAMPCTFIMTLESYLKTGQSQDSEQIVRGAIGYGPDHDDYLTQMAPKPVLVGAAAFDYFPIEGAMEAVARARRVYALYDAARQIDLTVAPTRHAYSPHLREAAVRWFTRHLMGRESDFRTGDPETLPSEALNCTEGGQVLAEFPGSRTLFDLNRERLAQSGAPGATVDQQTLRRSVAGLLGVPLEARSAPIYPRVLREEVVEGYPCEKLFFFSAPEIVVTGVMIHPRSNGSAVQTDLLLLEGGTSEMPAQRPRLERLLEASHRVFVFDVRGTGAVATRPVSPGGVDDPHRTEYKLGCDAMMLGISTLGLRVYDVLRGLDYLRSRPDVDSERIGLHGVGTGALFAFFAAALEDGWCELTVEDMLCSYRHLAESRYYNSRLYGMKEMAWGLLPAFDLPLLLPCLAPRLCRFVTPRDARGSILTRRQFEEEFLAVADAGRALPDGWRPELLTLE
jgi:cephalosporin-C deacetylase-like acetyl esterase